MHRDTINTFWNAVKYDYGYEVRKQKIIPLTVEQYVNFLEIAKAIKESTGKRLLSPHLKELLTSLSDVTDFNSPILWLNSINNRLIEWKDFVEIELSA